MARKPTGKPVGRPPIEIDWKHFEQLCHIQCLQSEIASFFKINVDTLHDRVKKQYGEDYSDVYKKFSDGGKSSLRRMQYRLAEKNVAMAIWLGKQYLGQKEPESKPQDKVEIDYKVAFDNLMKMFAASQSEALKIEDISKSADVKS